MNVTDTPTSAVVARARPSLHVPDEPSAARDRWAAQVLDGHDLVEVIEAPGGLGDWLWDRWRVLLAVGVDRASLGRLLSGYRREVWLWMAGERTWDQCCAGLIGRIGRRAGN
jgi:hypothetical protein